MEEVVGEGLHGAVLQHQLLQLPAAGDVGGQLRQLVALLQDQHLQVGELGEQVSGQGLHVGQRPLQGIDGLPVRLEVVQAEAGGGLGDQHGLDGQEVRLADDAVTHLLGQVESFLEEAARVLDVRQAGVGLDEAVVVGDGFHDGFCAGLQGHLVLQTATGLSQNVAQ